MHGGTKPGTESGRRGRVNAREEAEETVSDELVGTELGHCVIRALLGEGGMASVYRGYQPNLDREVAIKVLPPAYAADPGFVERFKLEARAMARLAHPHIVTIHDAGEELGRLYIVMAYVPGGTLKQRMGQPMDVRSVVPVIKDVASALSYAHERGIVHRDVKPVNVLIDNDGRAILSDFGIVKIMSASEGLTRVGAGVGTPEYMSPEQCRGGAVDTRADIYALGVMVYEMLTGHTPFEADNYTALAHAHVYEPVPALTRLNPRISPAVQAVVMKALAKEPSYRYQQASDMAISLEQAVAAQAPVAPSLNVQHMPGSRQPGRVTLSPPIMCPRCHQPNPPTQRFCSSCGLTLGVLAPQPSPLPAGGGMRGHTPAYVACPRCQSPNIPINRFCTRCGQPLIALSGVTCRQCGQVNARGQRFCTRCGSGLD